MKKTVISILISFTVITSLSSQEIVVEENKGLVSKSAYSMKIAKDFDYLLLGENSPQQGISATLNEKKSNIKISGLLYSGSKGIVSMEVDLAASNGVYFFDKSNGSEQGKISFNYYKKIKAKSEFYRSSNDSRVAIKLETVELIRQAKSDYLNLRKLLEKITEKSLFENVFGELDKDDAIKKLRYLSRKYINSQDINGYNALPIDELDNKKFITKNNTAIKLENVIKVNKSKKEAFTIASENLNFSKIIKEYSMKKKYILNELEKKINDAELENVESQWAGDHIAFVGISPFYERQSLKRFEYDSLQTFNNMFSSEKGDVFGVTLSLSYNLEKGIGSKNKWKPENIFMRLSATFSRASNISAFSNSTLNLTTPLGNDVNGNPIVFTNSSAAFIGDNAYEYGFSNSFVFETYYYPFKIPTGFFGRIGYNKIKFNKGSSIKDKEIYPMRLGILFNLKNKTKNKPLITIQTFLDRTNLNLKPTGNNGDLRFGIGIGLPININ